LGEFSSGVGVLMCEAGPLLVHKDLHSEGNSMACSACSACFRQGHEDPAAVCDNILKDSNLKPNGIMSAYWGIELDADWPSVL